MSLCSLPPPFPLGPLHSFCSWVWTQPKPWAQGASSVPRRRCATGWGVSGLLTGVSWGSEPRLYLKPLPGAVLVAHQPQLEPGKQALSSLLLSFCSFHDNLFGNKTAVRCWEGIWKRGSGECCRESAPACRLGSTPARLGPPAVLEHALDTGRVHCLPMTVCHASSVTPALRSWASPEWGGGRVPGSRGGCSGSSGKGTGYKPASHWACSLPSGGLLKTGRLPCNCSQQ